MRLGKPLQWRVKERVRGKDGNCQIPRGKNVQDGKQSNSAEISHKFTLTKTFKIYSYIDVAILHYTGNTMSAWFSSKPNTVTVSLYEI